MQRRTPYQKAKKQAQAEETRQANIDLFLGAAQAAKDAGMLLRRLTAQHFQLINRPCGWTIDLYPSKQMVLPSEGAPRLRLGYQWSLLDAVCAAIDKLGG